MWCIFLHFADDVTFESAKSNNSFPTAVSVTPDAMPTTVANGLLSGKTLRSNAHISNEPNVNSKDVYKRQFWNRAIFTQIGVVVH